MAETALDTLRRSAPTPASAGLSAYSRDEADGAFRSVDGNQVIDSVTVVPFPATTAITGGATTTIVTLAIGAHMTAHRFVVAGENGTDAFCDVVIACVEGAGNVAVVSSTTVLGTPRNRSYSLSASAFRLALDGAAGQTYTIRALRIDL